MHDSAPPSAPGVPSKKTIVFTTAPPAYDWWFTSDLGVAGTTMNRKVVRRVAIETDRVEQQCDRYASGCHMAVDEVEWRKLVEYKLATIA